MRYEESHQRRRLSGQIVQRGRQTSLSTIGGWLFGLPFVAGGTAIALIGLKVIAVDPATVHAPYWVLTVCGACFLGAGLMVWGLTLRQFRANRRRAAITGTTRADLALVDYPWDTRGCQPSRWGKAGKAGAAALAMSIFLSIFNWWAFFSKDGPLLVKLIVGVFDFFLVWAWGYFFLTIARAIRFNASRLEFTEFPYSTQSPILLRWQSPTGLTKSSPGSFRLRCAEEWTETTGSGDDRSTRVVQEEIWNGTWHLEPDDELLPGEIRVFKFEPPAEAQPTSLSAGKTIYWEFEVKLEMAGPDFVETYLVPVYS
ncbi:MAG: hypothetical protein QM813_03750 [Verrucomicrobiota bacterium]